MSLKGGMDMFVLKHRLRKDKKWRYLVSSFDDMFHTTALKTEAQTFRSDKQFDETFWKKELIKVKK